MYSPKGVKRFLLFSVNDGTHFEHVLFDTTETEETCRLRFLLLFHALKNNSSLHNERTPCLSLVVGRTRTCGNLDNVVRVIYSLHSSTIIARLVFFGLVQFFGSLML